MEQDGDEYVSVPTDSGWQYCTAGNGVDRATHQTIGRYWIRKLNKIVCMYVCMYV